jgi:hypothetical protein
VLSDASGWGWLRLVRGPERIDASVAGHTCQSDWNTKNQRMKCVQANTILCFQSKPGLRTAQLQDVFHLHAIKPKREHSATSGSETIKTYPKGLTIPRYLWIGRRSVLHKLVIIKETSRGHTPTRPETSANRNKVMQMMTRYAFRDIACAANEPPINHDLKALTQRRRQKNIWT